MEVFQGIGIAAALVGFEADAVSWIGEISAWGSAIYLGLASVVQGVQVLFDVDLDNTARK